MDKTAGVIGLISTVRDKANRLILDQLRKRGIEDLVPAHGAIFVALFRRSELSMGQIAKIIKRDKSTVTTLVSKLNDMGYLERKKDDVDGRVSLIRLTEKGKSLKPDFEGISKNLISKVYRGFSEREKQLLMNLLTRVEQNL